MDCGGKPTLVRRKVTVLFAGGRRRRALCQDVVGAEKRSVSRARWNCAQTVLRRWPKTTNLLRLERCRLSTSLDRQLRFASEAEPKLQPDELDKYRTIVVPILTNSDPKKIISTTRRSDRAESERRV
jgi:hypothetical protein